MTQQDSSTASTTVAASQTAAQQSAEPNVFELSNQDVHVTYSTSSIAGQTQLGYRTSTHALSFQQQDIRVEQSELGTLVTVSTVKTVDRGYTSLTLILPRVNLADSPQQNISAIAIVTTHLYNILPHVGAQQLYSVHQVHGVARLVEF
jgi:hypothetical protein